MVHSQQIIATALQAGTEKSSSLTGIHGHKVFLMAHNSMAQTS